MPRRQIADSAALRTGQFADGGKCASTAILYPQRSIAARNTMGLPHWSHDRKCFYKYASAATAKLILEKNSLRWALPTSFNDPFDVQFDLRVEYDTDRVIDQALQNIVDLYMGRRHVPNGNKLAMVSNYFERPHLD